MECMEQRVAGRGGGDGGWWWWGRRVVRRTAMRDKRRRRKLRVGIKGQGAMIESNHSVTLHEATPTGPNSVYSYSIPSHTHDAIVYPRSTTPIGPPTLRRYTRGTHTAQLIPICVIDTFVARACLLSVVARIPIRMHRDTSDHDAKTAQR